MDKENIEIRRGRWISTTPSLHICKCGLCFTSLGDWVLHKKDTRRWRKYHQRLPFFGIFRVVKNG